MPPCLLWKPCHLLQMLWNNFRSWTKFTQSVQSTLSGLPVGFNLSGMPQKLPLQHGHTSCLSQNASVKKFHTECKKINIVHFAAKFLQFGEHIYVVKLYIFVRKNKAKILLVNEEVWWTLYDIAESKSVSQVSKTMGTSVSLVGGGLTIAGGILTIATAGVATPVLIAGTNNNWILYMCKKMAKLKCTKN